MNGREGDRERTEGVGKRDLARERVRVKVRVRESRREREREVESS